MKRNFMPLVMDSGATYIYQKYVSKNTKGAPGTYFKDKKKIDFSFYKTKIFKDFREAYIKFVKKNDKYLFAYVNMDVINNAEESYKSLKYMEDRGCHPLPVFHLGNDPKWLERYVEEGYKFICIGGITPNPYVSLKPILDRLWSNILTDSKGMPLVKIHGLACTSFQLLKRYPWFSVDSATWTKLGAWGGIYVPRKVGEKFSFDKRPFGIQVSEKSSAIGASGMHALTLFQAEREHVQEWLDFIGVPFGSAKELGVLNDYQCRMKANLLFFQMLSEYLPKWPWPFKSKIRKGLNS